MGGVLHTSSVRRPPPVLQSRSLPVVGAGRTKNPAYWAAAAPVNRKRAAANPPPLPLLSGTHFGACLTGGVRPTGFPPRRTPHPEHSRKPRSHSTIPPNPPFGVFGTAARVCTARVSSGRSRRRSAFPTAMQQGWQRLPPDCDGPPSRRRR